MTAFETGAPRRMARKRRHTAVGLFVALAGVAAGCGDDDDAADSAPTETTTPSEATVAPTTVAEPSDTAEASAATTTEATAATDTEANAPDTREADAQPANLGDCGALATKTVGQAATTDTVRLASTAAIGNLPILIMEGNGSLDKIAAAYNTEIDVDRSLGGGDITAQLGAGNLDMMFNGFQNAPRLVDGGQDVDTILAVNSGGGVYIIGRSDLEEERGDDLANWTGATFGTTGPGSATELWLDLLAGQAGLTAYNKVPLGLAELYPAMVAERLDGFAAIVEDAARAITEGTGFLLADSTAAAVSELYGAPWAQVALTTRRQFAEENGDLVQALVTGLLCTMRNLADPAVTASEIQSTLPDGFPAKDLDPAIFENLWPLLQPGIANELGVFTEIRTDALNELLVVSGNFEEGAQPPMEDYIDNTYAVQAYEDLGLPLPSEPIFGPS